MQSFIQIHYFFIMSFRDNNIERKLNWATGTDCCWCWESFPWFCSTWTFFQLSESIRFIKFRFVFFASDITLSKKAKNVLQVKTSPHPNSISPGKTRFLQKKRVSIDSLSVKVDNTFETFIFEDGVLIFLVQKSKDIFFEASSSKYSWNEISQTNSLILCHFFLRSISFYIRTTGWVRSLCFCSFHL